MNGERLLKERLSRDWEQQETAIKLKVSQPYLSLIEAGKRPVTEKLAQRAMRVFNLPPTALPIKHSVEKSKTKAGDILASQLAGLGYPKFSHLKKTKNVNPATVLMSALAEDELDSRIVEALPWLVFNYSDMDWARVINSAKLSDAQNRLGFLLSLAFDLAKRSKDENKTILFKELLSTLDSSRLVQNDSFRRKSLTDSEKAWLRKNRPKNARHWRVLSNLSSRHLVC
jgi:transcriptional regulator with XRE-family HTH domain